MSKIISIISPFGYSAPSGGGGGGGGGGSSSSLEDDWQDRAVTASNIVWATDFRNTNDVSNWRYDSGIGHDSAGVGTSGSRIQRRGMGVKGGPCLRMADVLTGESGGIWWRTFDPAQSSFTQSHTYTISAGETIWLTIRAKVSRARWFDNKAGRLSLKLFELATTSNTYCHQEVFVATDGSRDYPMVINNPDAFATQQWKYVDLGTGDFDQQPGSDFGTCLYSAGNGDGGCFKIRPGEWCTFLLKVVGGTAGGFNTITECYFARPNQSTWTKWYSRSDLYLIDYEYATGGWDAVAVFNREEDRTSGVEASYIDYDEIALYRNGSMPACPTPLRPTYASGMADFDVRQLTGAYAPSNGNETIEDVVPSVAPNNWPASDPSGHAMTAMLTAWGSAAHGIGTKMPLFGGGHRDHAFNGLPIYDFDGRDAPVGFTLGPVSDIADVQDGDTYADGLPSAAHVYDGFVQLDGWAYKFGGAPWRIDGGWMGLNANWRINLNATTPTWEQLPNVPGGFTQPSQPLPTVIVDPYSKKILFMAQQGGSVAFYNTLTNTWGNVRNPSQSLTYDGVCAYDTYRRRMISTGDLLGVFPRSLWTIDWEAETITESTYTPTGTHASVTEDNALCCFYDEQLDCFWMFGGKDGDPGYSNMYKMDASTFAVTQHPLSSSIATYAAGEHGSYNRYLFMSDWRLVAYVSATDQAPYIIKLPDPS